jgi:general secretion pathway protein L
MQKIIGLDIGSYSVKAIEIINSFKSYEITNFYENVIPPIDEIDPNILIPTCMEQLFQENRLNADRILTALSGQYISSRIIPFNFSDPHKIEAAVYSVVEDSVPFNLEDMVTDHQIIGQLEDKTIVLVVLTKKVFMRSFLNHLQLVNIDPKIVDVDSLAFYNLFPHINAEPKQVYGIVDIGHEKTSVCIIQDGVMRMFRSINLGGRYITEFIARDMEISYAEAQRIKHAVSRILLSDAEPGDLSEEELAVAKRITLSFQGLAKELARTLYSFKKWEKNPLHKIYLSGGSSVIRDLDRYLSEYLEIETSAIHLQHSNLKINQDLVPRLPFMVQGIAVGLRGVTSLKRHSQINFRKGSFAYIQDYESIFRFATLACKMVAFSLILLAISYGIKYYSYSSQANKLKEQFKQEFIANLTPELQKKYKSGTFSFSKISSDAQSIIGDATVNLNAAIDGFLATNSDSGALLALKEISEHLPAEVKVNVVEYIFETRPDGTGKITLRIEAESFDVVSKFQAALKTITTLDSVTEKSSDSKPGSDIKIAVIEARYVGKSKPVS